MKGLGAEQKARAFRDFANKLQARGLPVPSLAIWDPRRETFVSDLGTLDGNAEGADQDLVRWIKARNQALEEGTTLPDYTAD